MKVLRENTVDAALEKHVPVVTRSEEGIVVTVGSVDHPMTPDHLY
nr:desulfoferrodoxin family protein [Desulfopila inferna]